ncbi:hypothetical protein EDB86DRAFT_3070183 [Lactarius hatsudake]|nr:hypothetical protein EDB86DRAFT_3070183 [Lactarius hatsudake]
MVDWSNNSTIAAENTALAKLVHVIGGIYIWEIVSCLGFEYSVISKKRKFTWSFLVRRPSQLWRRQWRRPDVRDSLYLGCRWCPLFAIALQFLGFDVSHKIDCQACVILSFMFAYLSFMCTSALIILRVVALWNHTKTIIGFTCAMWLGNTIIYAYSLTTLRSTWTEQPESFCAISHTDHGRISIFSTFTTDLILLVLMLTGLKRWKNAPTSCGVWRLLRTQGLIWVMIVTLVELPAAVFIFLNLNDPMNLISQAFAPIIAPLGAARLYRGLIDYPATNGLVKVVNEPRGEQSSPFSHQTYRTKQHDSVGGSVALDTLPVKTSDSGVLEREMFEGGNIV